jgi:CheY-like chemotaxis protein
MPGIDGYEVCRRLRAGAKTREIPVMFLSSLEDVQDKARGFEMGADDYLTKPFEILEVKARVRSLVKAKAYADAIKEAREMELSIAREIQMGILPADLSPCTKGTGLDIHVVLGVLVGAIVSLGALLVQSAIRTHIARASTHTIVLRHRAL